MNGISFFIIPLPLPFHTNSVISWMKFVRNFFFSVNFNITNDICTFRFAARKKNIPVLLSFSPFFVRCKFVIFIYFRQYQRSTTWFLVAPTIPLDELFLCRRSTVNLTGKRRGKAKEEKKPFKSWYVSELVLCGTVKYMYAHRWYAWYVALQFAYMILSHSAHTHFTLEMQTYSESESLYQFHVKFFAKMGYKCGSHVGNSKITDSK